MWQNFTQSARKAILAAREEARQMRSSQVDTEHLLLVLLREDDDVKAVLDGVGVNVEDVFMTLKSRQSKPSSEPTDEPKLAPRLKRALALAADEARKTKSHYIGTIHLLLGLLRENEGVAAQVVTDVCQKVLGNAEFTRIGEWFFMKTRQEAMKHTVPETIEGSGEAQAVVERIARVTREIGVSFSLMTRKALVRAADKALAANSDAIEFEHLVEAVNELALSSRMETMQEELEHLRKAIDELEQNFRQDKQD